MQTARLAIIFLAIGSTLAIARCAAAAPAVSTAESTYCHDYAESEYQDAVDAGSAFPDAAYEGAQAECEVQWLVLAAQWDDPANLDRVARLANKLDTLSDACGAAK